MLFVKFQSFWLKVSGLFHMITDAENNKSSLNKKLCIQKSSFLILSQLSIHANLYLCKSSDKLMIKKRISASKHSSHSGILIRNQI